MILYELIPVKYLGSHETWLTQFFPRTKSSVNQGLGVYETHNYFASVFNNGRMVDGGDLPIDFRTNAIIGPNVQFLNKGKETYWHFLTSSQ